MNKISEKSNIPSFTYHYKIVSVKSDVNNNYVNINWYYKKPKWYQWRLRRKWKKWSGKVLTTKTIDKT